MTHNEKIQAAKKISHMMDAMLFTHADEIFSAYQRVSDKLLKVNLGLQMSGTSHEIDCDVSISFVTQIGHFQIRDSGKIKNS